MSRLSFPPFFLRYRTHLNATSLLSECYRRIVINSLDSSLSIGFTAKWIYKMNDTIVYKCPAINFRRRVSHEISSTANAFYPRFIYVIRSDSSETRESQDRSRKKKGLLYWWSVRVTFVHPWCISLVLFSASRIRLASYRVRSRRRED